MFNLEEFENNLILEKVDKLNKYLSKNKITKVSKIVDELENLLDQEEYVIPITYILSVLAENNLDLISEGLIQKIEVYFHSEDEKLKINSLIIIGFAMIANLNYFDRYNQKFITFLTDTSEDIRNNIHYFLHELVKVKPNFPDSIIDILLESLKIEKSSDNIISLLNILEKSQDLNFDQLYDFRIITKSLISSFQHKKKSGVVSKSIILIKRYFPQLEKIDLEKQDIKILKQSLDNQFLMKKYNFSAIKKKSGMQLKEYIKNYVKTRQKEKKIYFYIKTKKNVIYIFELEKDKLISFFEPKMKISHKNILTTFSQIITTDSELKIFIKTLIDLKIIDGYYSALGYFYPYPYLKSKILDDFQSNGELDLNNYNFLPPNIINKIIQEISKLTNQTFLRGRNQKFYFSLKSIHKQINSEAAKNSIIDLKPDRAKLLDEDFIKLIKNLPKEYLSHFRKGTQWLTNLGTLKIKKEVQNSKIVGYFDISKTSEKLNIGEILLIDVFDHFIDSKTGMWDKKREIFYYSKYLNERIKKINAIPDEEEKLKQIDKISKKLNIDKNHIISKLDENVQLIVEEIKQKGKININDYAEKMGMEEGDFMKFFEDLEIKYFKKADILFFNPEKIDEAKNDIKNMLIKKSKSADYISLGTFEITSHLIEELINTLLTDEKLKGIFHETNGELVFFTKRGIQNLMLENSFLFSFHDLFYGKDLNQEEINLLMEIFDDLIDKKRISGEFDKEELIFSSIEVLFAQDYNTVLFDFEKMVNSYLAKFDLEFQKIKRLLTKKEETIFPQEIRTIQDIIDNLNEKYVWWRNRIEAFVNRANMKLLKDQGFTVKQYKSLFSEEKKDEIKSLAEDPDVCELSNKFKSWVSIFNKLELKYPNVIFYQKRLINNPDDSESKNNLIELLNELYLV